MAYKFSYINNCKEQTTISVRNVSTKNPESALQFVIEQDRGKRRYIHSFDLPATEIPRFIEAIQKED